MQDEHEQLFGMINQFVLQTYELRVVGWCGIDVLNGDAGNDTIDGSSLTTISVDLNGGDGADQLLLETTSN